MATIAKKDRLEIRLHASQKELLEAAATSKSLSLTQWAISVLSDAARRDLEEEYVTVLSAKRFDAFAEALEKPAPEAVSELLRREPVWSK